MERRHTTERNGYLIRSRSLKLTINMKDLEPFVLVLSIESSMIYSKRLKCSKSALKWEGLYVIREALDMGIIFSLDLVQDYLAPIIAKWYCIICNF